MEEDSRGNEDAGFVSNGDYTGMEWESEPGNVTLKIDQNGHISGGGTQHPQHSGLKAHSRKAIWNWKSR